MVRKLLLLGALGAGLAGCHHCSKCDRVQTGWRFEVIRPPMIEQSAPMLVQQSPGYLTTQSMGAVAGPIAGGEFYQQPAPQMIAPQMAPMAAPPCMPYANGPARSAPAVGQQQRLTCEEWCELMRETARQRGTPLPIGPKEAKHP